jgi:uncharacterized protein (DUF2062 family)
MQETVPGKRRIAFLKILHLDDEPYKIAGGFAVGVFISFSPLYGAHMLLALGLAFLFRLNKAAAAAGTWVVLPWFAPLVLGFSYLLGRFLMGQGFSFPSNPSLEREWILRNFLPLLLGCSLVGALAAAFAYFFARRTVEVWRARHKEIIAASDGHQASPVPPPSDPICG